MLDTASASVTTLTASVADPYGRAVDEAYPDYLAFMPPC